MRPAVAWALVGLGAGATAWNAYLGDALDAVVIGAFTVLGAYGTWKVTHRADDDGRDAPNP